MKISFDNKILQGLSYAFDMLLLSFLWMLCSLPVFTLGAAAAGVYSVLLGVDQATGSVTLRFFRAFKSNFKQTSLIWLLLMVLGTLIGFEGYMCWSSGLSGIGVQMVQGVICLLGLIYLTTLSLIFAIAAKFKVSFKQAFYNVLVLGGRHPLQMLLLDGLTLAELASYALLYAFGFIPAALCIYLKGLVYGQIFKPYLPDDE